MCLFGGGEACVCNELSSPSRSIEFKLEALLITPVSSRRPSKSTKPFRDPSRPTKRANMSINDRPWGERQRRGAASGCSGAGDDAQSIFGAQGKRWRAGPKRWRASRRKTRSSPAPPCAPSADVIPARTASLHSIRSERSKRKEKFTVIGERGVSKSRQGPRKKNYSR